jgi:serine protease Do
MLRSMVALLAAVSVAVMLSSEALAQRLLDRLEERLGGVLAREPAPVGAVPAASEPGYLGLVADNADGGVRVLTVRPGSAAELAAIREGDLITSIGGVAVANLDDMQTQLAGKPAGSRIDFVVQRGGESQSLPVTLTRRPTDPAPEDRAPLVVPPRALEPAADARLPSPRVPLFRTDVDALEPAVREVPRRASLGVSVLPITADAQARYRLAVRQGALIGSVVPGSAADQAGLPVGAVVVAAEGRRIERPDDLIAVIAASRPGDEIMLSYYQGTLLYRKNVRLGEAPGEAVIASPEIPAADFREIDESRPLLRRLERALDGLTPERAVVREPEPFVPRIAEPAATDLRTEVEQLRRRVADLERRLAEVEGRLDAGNAVEPEPQVEDPALELEPPAAPARPAVPPPRPEPEPAAENR